MVQPEHQPDNSAPDQDTDAAIWADQLSKRFKNRRGAVVNALNGVSFAVGRENVFAILGPNGAGKTTLLRILTTVMRPTSGTARIAGFEIGRQNIHIRQHIGIVAQENHFDRYLSVHQNLTLHARMHGMEKPDYERRIRELLEMVNLYDRRNDYIENFSGGMQRRVALIRALIHRPRILFLDEPSTGLDPAARLDIWETIQNLKQNTTVILTTHYMEEADRLSDRIMILNHGRVVMVGTPQELKQAISPPDTYELRLTTPTAEQYRGQLASLAQEAVVLDPQQLDFRLSRPEQLSEIVACIRPDDLLGIQRAQADLETVYLTVAGEQVALSSVGSDRGASGGGAEEGKEAG